MRNIPNVFDHIRPYKENVIVNRGSVFLTKHTQDQKIERRRKNGQAIETINLNFILNRRFDSIIFAI